MRLPNNLKSGQLGFNMTPMIDVVFLLIIFFLVSSHLAKQETQLELPLPVAESGEDDNETATRRMTLNVLADGSVTLAGRRVNRGQLRNRLEEARQGEAADVEVRIRSDRNVPYHNIEPVLLSCARAGIWNVTFGVFRPEDVR
jgi:biopolymer transport protein ExbD